MDGRRNNFSSPQAIVVLGVLHKGGVYTARPGLSLEPDIKALRQSMHCRKLPSQMPKKGSVNGGADYRNSDGARRWLNGARSGSRLPDVAYPGLTPEEKGIAFFQRTGSTIQSA